LILIGSVQLLNLGLKTWIFTKADNVYYVGACQRPVAVDGAKEVPAFDQAECERQQKEQRSAQRQSQASSAIAMILVGSPVWLYHWGKVKNEQEASKQ